MPVLVPVINAESMSFLPCVLQHGTYVVAGRHQASASQGLVTFAAAKAYCFIAAEAID